jgi:hypothetical protein
MARSSRIYVLSWWVSHEVFAAFTVRHEMHTYAARNDLYEKNVRVTSLPDGLHSGRITESLLTEES